MFVHFSKMKIEAIMYKEAQNNNNQNLQDNHNPEQPK